MRTRWSTNPGGGWSAYAKTTGQATRTRSIPWSRCPLLVTMKGRCSRPAALDTETRELRAIETGYSSISSVRAGAGRVYFIGGSPGEATAVVQLDLATGETNVLKRASDLTVDPGYLSQPEAITFPTE